MKNQKRLFTLIESKLNADQNLYKAVAQALNIEYDAARRRVVGNTAITFEEACMLKSYFKIGLDQASVNGADYINFEFKKFEGKELAELLELIMGKIKFFGKCNEVVFICKDPHVFFNFLSLEVMVYKFFYFKQVMWPDSELQHVKFDYQRVLELFCEEIPGFIALVHEIRDAYLEVDSAEIWNPNTMDTYLENVEYSWDAGYFSDKENALHILDKTAEVIAQIKNQVTIGEKIAIGESTTQLNTGRLEMYYSEGMRLENSVLVNKDDYQQMFLVLNTGDHISTTHPVFCKRGENYVKNLKAHSILISKVSVKQRNKLFDSFHQKIAVLRAKITHSTSF